MTGRRLTGAVLTIAGAASGTVCLASASGGFRDVMQTDGGFCGNGGPYVIGNQCSADDVRMISVGVLGGLVAAAIYAVGTSLLGRSASSAGLVMWVALFGALGWNFISLGLRPAAATGASSGWLFTGGMFWLMALGGLIPLLAGLVVDFRPAPAYLGPREAAYFGPPALVQTGARRIGIWLVGSLAGTGLGLAATSGLIGALR